MVTLYNSPLTLIHALKRVCDLRSKARVSVVTVCLFGLIVTLFCLLKVWDGDAVEYSFVVPENYADNHYERIETFSDIIRSQQTHYTHVNGRVAAHVLVQYFCAIGRKVPFAIADGLVAIAFIILLMRLSGASWRRPGSVLTTCLLAWMYLTPFFFDPPYQIGYLWVPTLICLFIYLYDRPGRDGIIRLLLLGILSFIAGQAHEGFSAGIAIGLIAMWIHRRFRLTPRQWVMTVLFGAGVLTHLMSGGNISRLADAGQRIWFTIPFFLLRFIPMIYVYGAVLLWRRQCGQSLRSCFSEGRFWIWATAGYVVVLIYTGVIYAFSCAPANFFLLILTLKALPRHRLRGGMLVAVALICCLLIGLKAYSQYMVSRKYSYIRAHYLNAPDTGIVVLPYDLYAYDYRPMHERDSVFKWEARAVNPQHAPLRVYPKGLEQIPADLDTNMIIPFGADGIIAVQSRQHPRPMILHHRFGPLRWTRPLSFSPDDMDFIDSTATWAAVVYINPSPTFKPISVEIGEPQK